MMIPLLANQDLMPMLIQHKCFLHHRTMPIREQQWPSGNAYNSDQHGSKFKAHHRSLVVSGRASGLKCLCQN